MKSHNFLYVLLLTLTSALFAGTLWAQVTVTGGPGLGAGDYPTLTAALAALTDYGDYEVDIYADQNLAPTVIPFGLNITLASGDGGAYAVRLSSSGPLFSISTVASLTLQDGITLVGRSANNAPVVVIGAGSVFNMRGGRITGNSVSSTLTGANRAGGVGVDDGGTFTMYGGEISGNAISGSGGSIGGAGAVIVFGSGAGFDMRGGLISGNTNSVVSASIGNGSGGVYVSDGIFNMTGGTISGNAQTGDLARAAGGVYCANAARFEMYGGTIERNTSRHSSNGNGDGVFVIGTSKIFFGGAPVISDGLFIGSTLSPVINIDHEFSPDALIRVQGSSVAGQMASMPRVSVTATRPGLTESTANAFISADNSLIGTAAGNRVVWAENAAISINITGNMDFGALNYGYVTQYGTEVGHTMTVSNIHRATGPLTISLSGAGAEAFLLDRTFIDNIEMDTSEEFNVKMRLGLPVGVYTAAVTVAGAHGVSSSFEVRVTVNRARLIVAAEFVNTVYGSPAPAFTANYMGLANDDTPDALQGALNFDCDYRVGSGAGSYSIRPSGLLSDNYAITYTNGYLTVDKREITIFPSDIVYDGKVYDGTTDADAGFMIALSAASGVVDGDALSASFTSARYDDKNAGARSVIFSGVTLRGSAADNYRLASSEVVKEGVVISRRDLILKANDVLVFAGAEPEFTYTLIGLVDGETKDVITAAPVFIMGSGYVDNSTPGRYAITPSGAVAANYSIVYQDGVLTISNKEDVSGEIVLENSVFVYDGLPKSQNVVYRDAGEHITYQYLGTAVLGDGRYSSDAAPADVGSYIVMVKYEDDSRIGKAMATLFITPKPLTVSGASHTKVYDGSRVASGVSVTLDGVVDGDDVDVETIAANYLSQRAGTTEINITSLVLTGEKSGNYTVDVPVTVTVEGITPKPITADMFVVASQIYNGSELTPIPVAVDGGNTVTFSVDGYSNNINAGTASVVVSGTENYTGTLTLGFQISRLRLTVTARDRAAVYGLPAQPFLADFSGFVNGETPASLLGELSFDCAYSVGSDAGVYTITPRGLFSSSYDIEYVPGTLTVDRRAAFIAVEVNGKVYDGTVSATLSTAVINNRYGDDDIRVVPGTVAFVDKNAGTGKAIVSAGWSISGAKAGNYFLVGQPVATADIAPKEITVNPGDIAYNGKIYDGTADVTGLLMITLSSSSGIIAGDMLAAGFTSARYNDKNAGARAVEFSGIALRGPDAGNYHLSSTATVKENVVISRRDLILKADDKLVFVGDPASEPVFTYTLIGLVDGETEDAITTAPAFAAGSGYVDNSTPGRYTVTPSGAVAGNYNIIFQNGVLTVSDKQNISGEIVLDNLFHIYDGSPKSPSVIYSVPSGDITAAFWYTGINRAGAYNSDAAPVDAGRYVVTVICESDSRIGKAMAAMTILPKPLDIIAASHTKVYDGARSAFGVRVVLDGIVAGDEVSASAVTAIYAAPRAGTTAVDITSVRLVGADSSNYTVLVPATMTVAGIMTKPITEEMFFIASQAYTGSERRPVPAASDGGNVVTFSIGGYTNNINPGTAYVTVSGTENYGGTLTLGFTITPSASGGGDVAEDSTGTIVGAGWGSVEIDDWTYGEAPNAPVALSATNWIDNMRIEYKRWNAPDETYILWEDAPVNAGAYTVRAVFAATAYYSECTATANFTIFKAHQERPYVPLIEAGVSTPANVPGLSADIPRVPADISGLRIDVSASSVTFIVTPDVPDDIEGWEYSIDGGTNWLSGVVGPLLPNSEYVILIRNKETENFLPSEAVALLIRTPVAGSGEIAGGVPEINSIPVVESKRDAPDRFGILLGRRVVSSKAEFAVIAPEGSNVNIVIYDNLGNAVFKRSGVKSGEEVTWDLTGIGRTVSNGSYLIIAAARDKSGKAHRFSAMLNVRK